MVQTVDPKDQQAWDYLCKDTAMHFKSLSQLATFAVLTAVMSSGLSWGQEGYPTAMKGQKGFSKSEATFAIPSEAVGYVCGQGSYNVDYPNKKATGSGIFSLGSPVVHYYDNLALTHEGSGSIIARSGDSGGAQLYRFDGEVFKLEIKPSGGGTAQTYYVLFTEPSSSRGYVVVKNQNSNTGLYFSATTASVAK